jgi:hypothetical protein
MMVHPRIESPCVQATRHRALINTSCREDGFTRTCAISSSRFRCAIPGRAASARALQRHSFPMNSPVTGGGAWGRAVLAEIQRPAPPALLTK